MLYLLSFVLLVNAGVQANTPFIISSIDHDDIPPPPPVDKAAQYARYIVRNSDWCSLSHVSHQDDVTKGYPVSRVYSFSDGPFSNSSGIPYIYTTFEDGGARDLKTDVRSSITVSLAQGAFCDVRNLDPEDPRCPQVILTGDFEFLEKDSDEWKFGQNALFEKHPAMKTWPKSHKWMVSKLNIKFIELVDNVGGGKYPTVQEYFNASPEHPSAYHNKIPLTD
ncbi:protein CREG1 [Nilaparvata lugens]|uniref:protein CREG1 n=1 Tax=Nilaparvata lugens TaxID=108931 RepID=UPI00193CD221|nr:protein CREG1 [Nilaparvata lugens]XP_022196095.2 protein CREG1 [Nilaparvata lugens]XP_039290816.1 protein CREG1 [Nilaparvata lugens]XP_039290817.1 protein CREG1 [Nilaparvata lugens]